MSDIKLTQDGDIDVSSGDLQLIHGVEAVAQHIRTRLRFFQGEWFLDTRLGVPYFHELLGHRPNLAAVKALFRRPILDTPGVRAISSISVDYDRANRALKVIIDAQAAVDDEPMRLEEEIPM